MISRGTALSDRDQSCQSERGCADHVGGRSCGGILRRISPRLLPVRALPRPWVTTKIYLRSRRETARHPWRRELCHRISLARRPQHRDLYLRFLKIALSLLRVQRSRHLSYLTNHRFLTPTQTHYWVYTISPEARAS